MHPLWGVDGGQHLNVMMMQTMVMPTAGLGVLPNVPPANAAWQQTWTGGGRVSFPGHMPGVYSQPTGAYQHGQGSASHPEKAVAGDCEPSDYYQAEPSANATGPPMSGWNANGDVAWHVADDQDWQPADSAGWQASEWQGQEQDWYAPNWGSYHEQVAEWQAAEWTNTEQQAAGYNWQAAGYHAAEQQWRALSAQTLVPQAHAYLQQTPPVQGPYAIVEHAPQAAAHPSSTAKATAHADLQTAYHTCTAPEFIPHSSQGQALAATQTAPHAGPASQSGTAMQVHSRPSSRQELSTHITRFSASGGLSSCNTNSREQQQMSAAPNGNMTVHQHGLGATGASNTGTVTAQGAIAVRSPSPDGPAGALNDNELLAYAYAPASMAAVAGRQDSTATAASQRGAAASRRPHSCSSAVSTVAAALNDNLLLEYAHAFALMPANRQHRIAAGDTQGPGTENTSLQPLGASLQELSPSAWPRVLLSQCPSRTMLKEPSLVMQANVARLAQCAPYWAVVLRYQLDKEPDVTHVTSAQLMELHRRGNVQVQTLLVGATGPMPKQVPAHLFRPIALLLAALSCGLPYHPVHVEQGRFVPTHPDWCLPPCLFDDPESAAPNTKSASSAASPSAGNSGSSSRPNSGQQPPACSSRWYQLLGSCSFWMVLQRYDESRAWRLVDAGGSTNAQAQRVVRSGFTPVLALSQTVARSSWAPTCLFLPVAALQAAVDHQRSVRALSASEMSAITNDNRLGVCASTTPSWTPSAAVDPPVSHSQARPGSALQPSLNPRASEWQAPQQALRRLAATAVQAAIKQQVPIQAAAKQQEAKKQPAVLQQQAARQEPAKQPVSLHESACKPETAKQPVVAEQPASKQEKAIKQPLDLQQQQQQQEATKQSAVPEQPVSKLQAPKQPGSKQPATQQTTKQKANKQQPEAVLSWEAPEYLASEQEWHVSDPPSPIQPPSTISALQAAASSSFAAPDIPVFGQEWHVSDPPSPIQPPFTTSAPPGACASEQASHGSSHARPEQETASAHESPSLHEVQRATWGSDVSSATTTATPNSAGTSQGASSGSVIPSGPAQPLVLLSSSGSTTNADFASATTRFALPRLLGDAANAAAAGAGTVERSNATNMTLSDAEHLPVQSASSMAAGTHPPILPTPTATGPASFGWYASDWDVSELAALQNKAAPEWQTPQWYASKPAAAAANGTSTPVQPSHTLSATTTSATECNATLSKPSAKAQPVERPFASALPVPGSSTAAATGASKRRSKPPSQPIVLAPLHRSATPITMLPAKQPSTTPFHDASMRSSGPDISNQGARASPAAQASTVQISCSPLGPTSAPFNSQTTFSSLPDEELSDFPALVSTQRTSAPCKPQTTLSGALPDSEEYTNFPALGFTHATAAQQQASLAGKKARPVNLGLFLKDQPPAKTGATQGACAPSPAPTPVLTGAWAANAPIPAPTPAPNAAIPAPKPAPAPVPAPRNSWAAIASIQHLPPTVHQHHPPTASVPTPSTQQATATAPAITNNSNPSAITKPAATATPISPAVTNNCHNNSSAVTKPPIPSPAPVVQPPPSILQLPSSPGIPVGKKSKPLPLGSYLKDQGPASVSPSSHQPWAKDASEHMATDRQPPAALALSPTLAHPRLADQYPQQLSPATHPPPAAHSPQQPPPHQPAPRSPAAAHSPQQPSPTHTLHQPVAPVWPLVSLNQCPVKAPLKEVHLMSSGNVERLARCAPYWAVVLRYQLDKEPDVTHVTSAQLMELHRRGNVQVQTLLVGATRPMPKQVPAHLFRPIALLLSALSCGLPYHPVQVEQGRFMPTHPDWCIPPCLFHKPKQHSPRPTDSSWLVVQRYEEDGTWEVLNGGCVPQSMAMSAVVNSFAPLLGLAAEGPKGIDWAPKALFMPVGVLQAAPKVQGLLAEQLMEMNDDYRLVVCTQP